MRSAILLFAFFVFLIGDSIPAFSACTYDVNSTWAKTPDDFFARSYGAPLSKNVTLPFESVQLVAEITLSSEGCSWSESSTMPEWFESKGYSGGVESGRISRLIPRNDTGVARTGIYTVAGININVTQLPSCGYCSGKSTDKKECQYIPCSKVTVWGSNQSQGIRMNDNTLNALFIEYYNDGMGRFVSNKSGKDIFIPQQNKSEFASFLGSNLLNTSMSAGGTYAFDWGYAVIDAQVDFSKGAKSYDGCSAGSFTPIVGTIAVPGSSPQNIAVPGGESLVRVGVYTKQPINRPNQPDPISIVLGSTDPSSPLKFRYTRSNYSDDCIYDPQGASSCANVVFNQYNKLLFKATELMSPKYTYGGVDLKNYGWALAGTNPVEESGLYVSVNGGAETSVADCTDGYSEKAPPIDGQCGTAHGTTMTTMPSATPPSTTLCAKGNASAVSGSGPWTWTCNSYPSGGTAASCTAGGAGCPAGTSVNWTSGDYSCTGTTNAAAISGSPINVTATGTNNGSASFKCEAGTLKVQPGATCSPSVTCAAGTYATWTSGNTCGGSTSSVTNAGSTTSITSTNGNSGTATFLCGSTGSLTYQSGPCSAPASCSGTTASWGSSPSCSGYLNGVASGSSSTANSSNGNSGSATYSCNSGSWSGPTSSSCTAPAAGCTGMTVTWGSSPSCSGYLNGVSSGSSSSANTSTSGTSGSVTYTCNNGSWSGPTASSCTSTATSCPAQLKSWTVGSITCSGYTAEANSGFGSLVMSTNGKTGYNYYACTNGTWVEQVGTSSCNNSSCPATAVTWGAGGKCSGNLTAAGSGTQTVQDATSPTTGTASYTCSNGTWSGPSSSSCVSSCASAERMWIINSVVCKGTVGALAHGGSTQIASTNGKTGQATFTCNDGTLNYNGATATCSAPPVSCSKSITSTTTFTVPADISSLSYTLVGGGGGGHGCGGANQHGSGGAPGGGGGSTALLKDGSLVNYASGGMGGGTMDTCGHGGATVSGSVAVPKGSTLTVYVGGGGGGGGRGMSSNSGSYTGQYSKCGGGGGGSGYGGGGGGPACSGTGGAGGGASGGAGSGGSCAGGGGGGGAGAGSGGYGGGTYFGGGGGGGGQGQKGGNGGIGPSGGYSAGGGSAYYCRGNGAMPCGYGGGPGSVSFSYTSTACIP